MPQRGLIPPTEEANLMKFVRVKTQSEYRAKIITPSRFQDSDGDAATRTHSHAAHRSTGLRISEHETGGSGA